VGIYGPTNPARNGPWDAADICVSRFEECICHHRRRCRREVCCLLDIGVDEVRAAIDRRLESVRVTGGQPTPITNPAAARRTRDQGPGTVA
jgi:ADP-heptose:LPS heptosyltransferase